MAELHRARSVSPQARASEFAGVRCVLRQGKPGDRQDLLLPRRLSADQAAAEGLEPLQLGELVAVCWHWPVGAVPIVADAHGRNRDGRRYAHQLGI